MRSRARGIAFNQSWAQRAEVCRLPQQLDIVSRQIFQQEPIILQILKAKYCVALS